jgi:hypothetical protein
VSFDNDEFMHAVATDPRLQEFAAESLTETIKHLRLKDAEVRTAKATAQKDHQVSMHTIEKLRTKLFQAIKDSHDWSNQRNDATTKLEKAQTQVKDMLYFNDIESCENRQRHTGNFSYRLEISPDTQRHIAVCRECSARHHATV